MRLPLLPCTTLLVALLLAAAITSVTRGAMPLPAAEALLVVLDHSTGTQLSALPPLQQTVVLELRLPRTALALLLGALLAQCGAVSQGLFRNPLAEPGAIGVTAGAAAGAAAAIALLPPDWLLWSVPSAAFAGGLLTSALVFRLASGTGGTSVIVLLLAGIALTAFAQALIGFFSYFADDQQLRALNLWQMGSLANTDSRMLVLALLVLIAVSLWLSQRATALNALLLGEAEARHLGYRVDRLKLELTALIVLGTATAVACAGMIGFVGLVVPHLVRLSTGPNHRSLLPLSALCGALLLLIADVLARTLLTPAELPVGLVTALLGAPFFLALLVQQRRRGAL